MTTATDEAQLLPRPGMKRWVCEIGGYEMLNPSSVLAGDDHVEAAKQWLLRFGLRGHEPVKGVGLTRDIAHYRGATHYGFEWWGNPREWALTLPTAILVLLHEEHQKRIDTGVSRIFTEPVGMHRPVDPVPRRRKEVRRKR